MSLATLRDDHWYVTLARLSSEAYGAPFVPAYVTFGAKLDAVAQQERTLTDAVVMARAKAVGADNVINGLLDQVSSVIHDGKKPDLSLPQHILYFGSLAPAEARRGILGSQLALMSVWPEKLAKSTKPGLVALTAAVQAGVDLGTKAEQDLNDALAALAQFRLDGERPQLFDAYNALAATTAGGLNAFASNHKDLGLRADWPDSFFKHDSRNQAPKTVGAAKGEMDAAKAVYDDAKKVYDDAVAAAAADAAHAAEEAAAAEALKQAKANKEAADKAEKDAAEALKKAKKKK
jgi:hypothetical protein